MAGTRRTNQSWFFGEKATLTSVSLLITIILGIITITTSLCSLFKSEDKEVALNSILSYYTNTMAKQTISIQNLNKELKDCKKNIELNIANEGSK